MSLHLCAQIDNTSVVDRNGPCSNSLETYLALLSAWFGDKNTRVRFKKVHGHGVHIITGLGTGAHCTKCNDRPYLDASLEAALAASLGALGRSFAQILGMVRFLQLLPYKVPVACWPATHGFDTQNLCCRYATPNIAYEVSLSVRVIVCSTSSTWRKVSNKSTCAEANWSSTSIDFGALADVVSGDWLSTENPRLTLSV